MVTVCGYYRIKLYEKDGQVLIEPFKASNTADGFHMLPSRLNSLVSDNITSLVTYLYYMHLFSFELPVFTAPYIDC